MVPLRTTQRYVLEACSRSRSRAAARRCGTRTASRATSCRSTSAAWASLIFDPASGRKRVVHAFIFMACFSRHCFVWLTFPQKVDA